MRPLQYTINYSMSYMEDSFVLIRNLMPAFKPILYKTVSKE